MNERLQELAEQAELPLETQSLRVEKFAELIVQECVGVLYDNELWNHHISRVLNKHFGAES